MSQSQFVANQLVDSFWKSDVYPNIIFGIRLYNDTPLVNFEYPYQLLITFYSPSYGFYADTIQERGGIASNGIIAYQYGSWRGKMLDKNTIEWEGRLNEPPNQSNSINALGKLTKKVIWKRTKPLPNTQSDQMSPSNILNQATYLTNTSWGQQHKAYPAIYSNINL